MSSPSWVKADPEGAWNHIQSTRREAKQYRQRLLETTEALKEANDQRINRLSEDARNLVPPGISPLELHKWLNRLEDMETHDSKRDHAR